MTDEPAIATLRRAMDARTDGHRLDPGLAGTAWADAHASRPRRLRTGLAVAATVLAVAGGAAALALARDTDTPPATSLSCSGSVSTAALPTWARAGFSPAALHTRHVLGTDQEIVGILFVDLRAHQPAGTNNKILWAARDGNGPLHISARLDGSDTTATRTVDLGPSVVDLPAAGCWQMTLTWSGHEDTIALRYR